MSIPGQLYEQAPTQVAGSDTILNAGILTTQHLVTLSCKIWHIQQHGYPLYPPNRSPRNSINMKQFHTTNTQCLQSHFTIILAAKPTRQIRMVFNPISTFWSIHPNPPCSASLYVSHLSNSNNEENSTYPLRTIHSERLLPSHQKMARGSSSKRTLLIPQPEFPKPVLPKSCPIRVASRDRGMV